MTAPPLDPPLPAGLPPLEVLTLLGSLLAQNGDGVVIVDTEGKLRTYNEEARRQHGLESVDDEALIVFEVLDPTDTPIPHDAYPLRRALRGEVVQGIRLKVRAKDGRTRVLRGTASPLRLPGEAIIGAILVSRDETDRYRLERTLAASEERLQRVLASPIFGTIVTTDDGRIIDANDTFLGLLGYSREDLGKGLLRWDALTMPDSSEVSARALAELGGRGYTTPFEKEYRRKDGTSVAVLLCPTRIKLEDGQDANISFVIDVTERRNAKLRLELLANASEWLARSLDVDATYQRLVEACVPWIADWCAVDLRQPDGSLKRVAVMHPDPAKIALARELQASYPPDPESTTGMMAVLRTGKSEWLPYIPPEVMDAAARDDRHRALLRSLGLHSYVCVPLLSRGRTLGVFTLAQAESRRMYEPEDVRFAEDLAHRFGLALDNALLYREAQDAVRLRDEFLSVASHELKTPLTPLALKLQVLQRDLARGAQTGESAQSHVEGARRQVQKLIELVDGLLDVSRISAGRLRLEIEDVDLSELVKEISARFDQSAQRAGCTLQLHAAAPVIGAWDRLRLDQVVTNLISNALKYGAGHPVTVTVELVDDTRARLRVKDEGIGISTADIDRIFGRFERAVSDRHYGGLGLGLFITRQIVEALGGEVGVTSAPGSGSVFDVQLPRFPIDGDGVGAGGAGG